MFFGTIAALGLLLFAIRKQVDIIRRQDELARMREDFSSAMVHDMKNPISSILIGLKVLRSGKVDSKPEKKENTSIYWRRKLNICLHWPIKY